MSDLAFVDCETTGLDPDRHEVWEVGIIVNDEERRLFSGVQLAKADPMALKISGYHERHPYGYANPVGMNKADVLGGEGIAHEVARLTYGRHIVGAVPSFDAAFLRRLLLTHGYQPAWHYHLVDVEALAAGWLMADARRVEEDVARRQADPTKAEWEKAEGVIGGPWRRNVASLPWNSEELSKAVGVDAADFDRHTALGDARWAKAIYEAVIEGKRPAKPPRTNGERT